MNTFILPKISKLLKLPKTTAKFTRLRMADDQQFKQLMFQLVEAGFLSLDTLLEETGFDPVEEKEKIKTESDWFNVVKEARGVAEALTQGKQSVVISKYQVKAQEAAMLEQALIQTRQDNAANGHGISPQIAALAEQFLNIGSNEEKQGFLEQVMQEHGPEILTQLVKYLKNYSKQEIDPEKADEAKDKVDKKPKKKVNNSPAGKSKKPERSEERVKAGRKNA